MTPAEASAAFLQLTLIPAGLMLGGSDEDLAELEASLDELGASIPSEIEGDFEVVRDAYTEFAEGMSGIDFSDPSTFLDESVSGQMEEASAALETPEVEEAMANIEAYFDELCG